MGPVNNFSKSLLTVCAVFTLFFAQSAAALVTVDATTSAVGPVAMGGTFDVEVSVTWNGAGSLLGVFVSHQWDSSQLMLTNAVFPPAPAFETRPTLLANGAYYPGMGRLGTIAAGVFGDDLTSSARTVQYAKAPPAINAGNAGTQVIVLLTFQVVGVGDGIANVDGFFNTGDTGAEGDTFAFGTDVAVTVPEPSSAMLGLSALGCVFAVVSVRRRD